ncbi:CHASE2 domain-containing protein [Solitalea koreensis]|uniref:CHASE2 domain-containing protein n=1 Tax=Solitalea koreensis TaxID=543615 RepID=A0A521BBM2_9SPHI|nr:CHASE2 domain-containing protein [Solitalea koreensis]SMO44459.1 CHASE2 domain-containing protein [Solitalea koreensis]
MRNWLKWLISFGHAILLLVLTAFWINTDFSYGDEQLLVKWSSIFKRVILNIDQDPPKSDFLFINLAFEKALIPQEEGLGNEVITDRAKLAQFFEMLKRNQKSVKFTICDVFLKGRSENDSLLQSSISGIKNIVFPTHHDENGKIEELDINVPCAIADYRMASGGFLKFKLFQDEKLKTLPVYLFEKTEGRKISGNHGIYLDKGKLSLNSVIIDYQIRSHELFQQGEYPVVNLSELLILPEEIIVNDFLKNRIVLMGDFNNDVHETIFGSTPGTLILLNVYLTLKAGYHIITYWWLIFIVLGYTVFSRLMLFPDNDNEKLKKINWIGPLFGSVTYLSVLSMISYLLFNIHIQVLILTLYVSLLRYSIRLKKIEWNAQQVKEWALGLRETYFNFK